MTKVDMCWEFYERLSVADQASQIGLHLRAACAEAKRLKKSSDTHKRDAIGLRCRYEMELEDHGETCGGYEWRNELQNTPYEDNYMQRANKRTI
jgi:hypothetical protein